MNAALRLAHAKKSSPESGASHLRLLLACGLCLIGSLLTVFSFAPSKPVSRGGPKLNTLKVDVAQLQRTARERALGRGYDRPVVNGLAVPANSPTFGHPIISGIGGVGFEQDLRLDPSNPNRIYTSAPGTAAADTSWIWHSLDGGKTFKWVVGAAPLDGKVTTLQRRRRYRTGGGLGRASLF